MASLGRVLLTIIFGYQLRDHFGHFLADFSRVNSALLLRDPLGGWRAGGVADCLSLLDLTAPGTQSHWESLTGRPPLPPSADCLLEDLAPIAVRLLLPGGSGARAVDSETSPCRRSLESLSEDCGQRLQVTGDCVPPSFACRETVNKGKCSTVSCLGRLCAEASCRW